MLLLLVTLHCASHAGLQLNAVSTELKKGIDKIVNAAKVATDEVSKAVTAMGMTGGSAVTSTNPAGDSALPELHILFHAEDSVSTLSAPKKR